MCGKEKVQYKNCVLMVLALLFPDYQIKFTEQEIVLFNQNNSARINAVNYDIFKNIIITMFDLSDTEIAGGYNPSDNRASKIAEKLRKGKEKIAQIKGKTSKEETKVAILSRYISILSVGLQKNKNSFNNYTVFQLKDEFNRFYKKQSFDMYVKAKLAGAQDLEEVDNWMENIHL